MPRRRSDRTVVNQKLLQKKITRRQPWKKTFVFGDTQTDITGDVSITGDVDILGDTTSTSYLTRSSKRYKTNIKPLENSLEIVMNLEGVNYDWKETGKNDIGFIAEDVGRLVPEIVDWEENSEYANSLEYSRLTCILVEAVKAQQKQIDSLKQEINLLKQEKK